MVMPDLHSQEFSLTFSCPGPKGTNQVTDFVKWTSGLDGCEHGRFFFIFLLSVPGFLGVPAPHPPPSFQEATGPNPFRSCAFCFFLFCLAGAESAVNLAQRRNPAYYCWWGRCLSLGWRDQKDIFTPKQLCFVCLIIWLWFLGVLGEETGKESVKGGLEGKKQNNYKKLSPNHTKKNSPTWPTFSSHILLHTHSPAHPLILEREKERSQTEIIFQNCILNCDPSAILR